MYTDQFVSIAQALDGDHKSYLERKKHSTTSTGYTTQQEWSTDELDSGRLSAPKDGTTLSNPHAVAAQGYGSLVVSR